MTATAGTDLDRALRPLRGRPAEAAILVDFDGTLADIVADPEDARPVAGAREALEALAPEYGIVAVVTGRPARLASELVGAKGIWYSGLYGLEEIAPSGRVREVGDEAAADVPPHVHDLVEHAAESVPGSVIEPKGATVAVHYRAADDPEEARAQLFAALAVPAGVAGYELIEGKRVVELVPAGFPRKVGAVERLLAMPGIHAAMFAGDDRPDVEAFEELDRWAERGFSVVKVAVASEEMPPDLLEFADVTVDGPQGMVRLLQGLASESG